MNRVRSFNERVRAQKLLVFDIGKNEATYCKLGDSKAQTIDVSDITKIVMEYPGYAMTVEDCHMAPRTRKSMSQHYTEPKLNAFYKTALQYGEAEAIKLVDYHIKNGGVSRYKKFEHFLGL